MAKKTISPNSGLLPRQEWDEIGVSHDRVKTPQKTEVVVKMPRGMEKLLKNMQKGKKRNGR